jgi:hypothetical protein
MLVEVAIQREVVLRRLDRRFAAVLFLERRLEVVFVIIAGIGTCGLNPTELVAKIGSDALGGRSRLENADHGFHNLAPFGRYLIGALGAIANNRVFAGKRGKSSRPGRGATGRLGRLRNLRVFRYQGHYLNSVNVYSIKSKRT